MKDLSKDFGTIVKRILDMYKISQTDFASKVGISLSRLNNYINGRNYPPFDILLNMADVLDLPLDQLVGRSEIGLNYNTVDIIPLLTFFDHASSDQLKRTPIPIYRNIVDSTVLKNTDVFEHINKSTICPNDKAAVDAYSLVIGDDSMSPAFVKGDLVLVERHTIDIRAISDLNEIYAVYMSYEDSVGLALRKIILRENLAILVPINFNFSVETIDISKGFNPIAGKPSTIYRNLKAYKFPV